MQCAEAGGVPSPSAKGWQDSGRTTAGSKASVKDAEPRSVTPVIQIGTVVVAPSDTVNGVI